MRRIIYYVAASLDGYIARRDGSVDWLPSSPDGEDYGYSGFLADIDTLVMGRKTYEQVLTFGPWPYGKRRCCVFSRELAGRRDSHAEFIAGDIGEFLNDLRGRIGRDIWLVGGGEAATACLREGMVDRVILTVVPVVLGEGLPLFMPGGAGAGLVLRENRSFPSGMIQLTYDVVADPRQRQSAATGLDASAAAAGIVSTPR